MAVANSAMFALAEKRIGDASARVQWAEAGRCCVREGAAGASPIQETHTADGKYIDVWMVIGQGDARVHSGSSDCNWWPSESLMDLDFRRIFRKRCRCSSFYLKLI